jgi:peptidoglycan/LPS O-acetylase OafA/YrhL
MLMLACLMIVGFPLSVIDADIGRGLISFFAGGIVYVSYLRLRKSPAARLVFVMSAVIAVGGWLITIVELKFGILRSLLTAMVAPLPAAVNDVVARSMKQILLIPIRLVVMPASILALVLHESLGARIYKRFSSLGDITYSSYLIHFPMQLFIAIFVIATGSNPRTFQSGLGMMFFFIVLIILSFSSFWWFEMPMQHMLRTTLLRRRTGAPSDKLHGG